MYLFDFDFDGGSRLDALKALQRYYPDYSGKRRALKALNAINQLSIRVPAGSIPKIARITPLIPRAEATGTRAYLLHKVYQNDRAYIFDQDREGQTVDVIKVALSAGAAAGLKREAETLRTLYGRTEFTIPEVKAYRIWEDGCLIRMSAVSSDQVAHDKRRPLPEAVFDAVAILRVSNAPRSLQACQIDGWQEARRRIRTTSIERVAMDIRCEDEFEVSAAHRDLGSENVFSRPDARGVADFTLIDWEFFSDTAPAMTDRVSQWLGCRHRDIKGWRGPDRNALAEEFLADFHNTPGGQTAAILALLHLAELGIDLACYLTGEKK
ncbi:hypothetical protein [Oceanomicrobium pacificus]|uniref:Aminoglycoside phosphotransferase domain-containing protein n=1 Tax=Oceanomicrobium pacificus TaxID=2692916 RepID=A0A6B0TVK3_9RHOB|nr:hypothetical protein [Oceanomicrobium pacificus]MXU65013.1 hypothetical protein [Oceanomicrobium pacificus]